MTINNNKKKHLGLNCSIRYRLLPSLLIAVSIYFSEGGEGGGDGGVVRQEEIDRISRKLATLEMKVKPG